MTTADFSKSGTNGVNADPGNWPRMKLKPVGVVRSEIKTPMLHAGEDDIELGERLEKARKNHKKVTNALCELIIFPQWEELLDGIEGFSHLLVLYWPHLIEPERRNIRKVHPMGRRDLPRQGVFATCSPARPNPILVSVVPLVERTGNILRVKGLDALDGSPVLDIKPYIQPPLQGRSRNGSGMDGATPQGLGSRCVLDLSKPATLKKPIRDLCIGGPVRGSPP